MEPDMQTDIIFRRRHPRTDAAAACTNETRCGAEQIMGFHVESQGCTEVLCHDCLVEKVNEGGSLENRVQ